MKAKVYVTLKNGVLDPQGVAVLHAAHTLGYEEIKDVRVGKVFELELGDVKGDVAEDRLKKLSDQLLANTVIENFKIEII